MDATRAPIALILPARDEAATVADVLRRTPTTVFGHPVLRVVVDDGSTDDTARLAGAAGAVVIRHGCGRGLGAAVRTGLHHAVAAGATVAAFCDADGEYAPQELARMAAPILAGDADYVVGSRFAGRIGRMPPHRRLGNRLLTVALRWLTGVALTDGQSGFRALSRDAAAAARIVHDYNYAQVLTLDLVRRGARYTEVPISYDFRRYGRSFVRLPRYLSAVVPAVWRLSRAPLPPPLHPASTVAPAAAGPIAAFMTEP